MQDADKAYIWHPFDAIDTPENIAIEQAEGIYLYTPEGRSIIDAIGSWWVNLHGHCHPKLVKALQEQVQNLEHVIFSGFTHKPATDFAQRLMEATQHNYSKIFFSDNGSTATEVALKMAFQYWHNRGLVKTKVLALEGAYHGDTFGAMSAGERSKFNEPFFPFLFEVEFINVIDISNVESFLQDVSQKLSSGQYASFIFEPLVQGAAGMRIYDAKLLDQLLSICKQYEVITIADEVFTGFYRTGKLLASNHLQKNPDIVCLSKGITGGFMPLGATLCKSFIYEAFQSDDVYKTFFHGHSYTGNPLALALANASLELLLEPNTQQQIQALTQQQAGFSLKLSQKHAHIRCATLGTILSIEIVNTVSKGYFSSLKEQIYHYFLERDILLRPLGNVIYFLPMYCFTTSEMALVHDAIDQFLETLEAGR